MTVLGYPIDTATSAQRQAGLARARSMPVWPAEGSVVLEDGFFVVRFPDPVDLVGSPAEVTTLRRGDPPTSWRSRRPTHRYAGYSSRGGPTRDITATSTRRKEFASD